jgi:hypothetical protein
MKSVMPFTLQPEKHRGLDKIKLLNPNSTEVKGPSTQYREPHRVQDGLLAQWDADAAKAAMSIGAPIETWDFQWTEGESYWEREVLQCVVPEEAEALMPTKWLGYRWEVEIDETLAKVCSLCTALVDKFVALSHSGETDASANKWRLHKSLHEKLQAVMELLESSIGENVPILKLRDPEFVRQCWESMDEDERMDVLSSLGSLALDA